MAVVRWICNNMPTEHTFLNSVASETCFHVFEEILLPEDIRIVYVAGISLTTLFFDCKLGTQ